MDLKQALERIGYNEKRIREILNDLTLLRSTILTTTSDDKNTKLLLSSEEYRIRTALGMTKDNRKKACKILKMNERTFFRKLLEYGINN